MKPQRKDAGGRKSEQHPNHLQPKPSPVQSAVGSAGQNSDSTATSEHARTDFKPSPKSPSARNQPLGLNVSLIDGHDSNAIFCTISNYTRLLHWISLAPRHVSFKFCLDFFGNCFVHVFQLVLSSFSVVRNGLLRTQKLKYCAENSLLLKVL